MQSGGIITRFKRRKKSVTSKAKQSTKRRRSISLSKVHWLSDNKAIQAFREATTLEQGGLDPILKEPLIRPCLDHCHWTGETRGVLSQCVNTWEGQVLKYWCKYVENYTETTMTEALRNLADYLEQDYSMNPLHNSFVSDQRKAMERMTIETIIRKSKEDFNKELTSESKLKDDVVVEYMEHFIEHYQDLKGK